MDTVSTKRLITLAALLAALCAYTWSLRVRSVPEPPRPELDSIPRTIGEYAARDGYLSLESLRLLGADTTLARSYVSPEGGSIDLFIGYFADQQKNTQIHSPKHCYPGAGWDILSEGSTAVRLEGSKFRARRLLISDGLSRQIVVYWFNMRGRTIPDEFALKWNQMTSALLSRPQAASFIRFSTVIPAGGETEAEKDLTAFIEEISPYIIGALEPRPDDRR